MCGQLQPLAEEAYVHSKRDLCTQQRMCGQLQPQGITLADQQLQLFAAGYVFSPTLLNTSPPPPFAPYARTHARTHARKHERMHACTHAFLHACTHANTHAHVHKCAHAGACYIVGLFCYIVGPFCYLVGLFCTSAQMRARRCLPFWA